MRPLLHLVSVALLLPSLLFASGFVLLGHAIAGATLMEFLDRLLSDALWLVMWGIFAAALFLILILISGLFIRARWLAASCVAVLSIASAVVLIVLGSGPYSFGQWLFLLPGLVSLGISGWLAVEEWPGRTHYRPAT